MFNYFSTSIASSPGSLSNLQKAQAMLDSMPAKVADGSESVIDTTIRSSHVTSKTTMAQAALAKLGAMAPTMGNPGTIEASIQVSKAVDPSQLIAAAIDTSEGINAS